MAEMTTLAATLYRKYHTSIAPGFEDTTPGITARVEVFYDERFPRIQVSLGWHGLVKLCGLFNNRNTTA